MKINIKTEPSVSINNGLDYEVIVAETIYAQKDILKASKLCWIPEDKVWRTSGTAIGCTEEQLRRSLINKYNHKLNLK